MRIKRPSKIIISSRQHILNVVGCFQSLGGDLKAKEKREVLKGIKNGEYIFVVGTHAVISDDVEFNNLGLTIVDEEHKFGVIQRDNLRAKHNEEMMQFYQELCDWGKKTKSIGKDQNQEDLQKQLESYLFSAYEISDTICDELTSLEVYYLEKETQYQNGVKERRN